MVELGYYGINTELAAIDIRPVFRSIEPRWSASKHKELLAKLVYHNLEVLKRTLVWNVEHDIRYYRFIMEHIHQYFEVVPITALPNWDLLKQKLLEIGQYIKDNNLRLTTHPGLFNVLSSDKPNVIKQTIKRLDSHSLLMDLMDLPANDFYCINIHVGGATGGKDAALKRFTEAFKKLYVSTQKRLVIENDDKPSLYSVKELMWLYEQIGTPICFDYLHHTFHPDGLTEKEAIEKVIPTWEYTPVVHIVSSILNESQTEKNPRKHAELLYEKFNDYGFDLYGMVEASRSDVALLKYRNDN